MRSLKLMTHVNGASRSVKLALALVIATVGLSLIAAGAAWGGTLDRIREAKKITFGYRTDARPFSYRDEKGAAAGYSVELCGRVANQVKQEVGLPELTVEWVPVTLEERFNAVEQGKVDLLCGADSVSLTRRKQVSFSIPILASGMGAIMRADAPVPLRAVLTEGQALPHPIWRGSPARTILEKKTFSIVAGTASEKWLAGRIDAFEIDAKIAPVESYQAGIQSVLDRRSDVFFGDFPILLDAAKRNPSARDLVVLERVFTYEPLGLVLARGDEDFRLVVDRTLSRLFGTDEFRDLYAKWFGQFSATAAAFFHLNAIPE
jgi:polar amino acid transport system substrate-binding protein